MIHQSIYDYIKSEEARFLTDEVRIGDNWNWNLRTHVQLIFHLKHGQFFTGDNGQTSFLRAVKNVMEPILHLAYWTEDIEVKDVQLFIEGAGGRAISFLIKKFHDEVFVRKYDLDTLFDEITESDVDYGGVLVQSSAKGIPERIQFNQLAFCDQTNLLGAPIAFKHHFAPDALRNMAKLGWGKPENGATISIEELIAIAENKKQADGTLQNQPNTVPGKTIEVYICRGSLPESFLRDGASPDHFIEQVQIVAYYVDKDSKKQGVTLYRREDDGKALKFHSSQPIYGRALGRSTGEALLPDQVYTNLFEIHKTEMLEAAAKTALYTDDETFTNKNKIRDLENLQVLTIEEGKSINIVPTVNVASIQLFEKQINGWYEHAQLIGSAFDPLMGKEASSGTTFKGQERTVAQGRGLHDRRRGQRAKFIERLYREDIIPKIVSELTDGVEFLATLSLEEMTWVVDQMTTNHVNRRIIDGMLEGKLMTPEERDLAAKVFRESFIKGGNKKLLKILKDEVKDIETRIGINIAGKQKDLVNLSDKLLSVFQFIFQNPTGFQQAMQIPALAKSFTDIMEFSGLNQADFASILTAPAQPAQLPAPAAAEAAPAALLTGQTINPVAA